MHRNLKRMWLRVLLPGFWGLFATAAPPGASLFQKLLVPTELRTGVFASDRYVKLPPGFRLSVWSRVPDARFLAITPLGDVLISQPDLGRVALLQPAGGGELPSQSDYLTGLRSPHGLAFDSIDGTDYLYVAETDQVDRYVYDPGNGTALRRAIIIRGLPSGGAHPLKSIAIGPDHRLYVGIGSSCNACAEDTTAATVRGSVYSFNPDGSGAQLFAQGLRNPEGLAVVPASNQLWAAVNNRDEIIYPRQDATNQYGRLVRSYVDDHPPELFTSVRLGGDYGWPFCNPTQDTSSLFTDMGFEPDFELNRDGHINCASMDRVARGIQAHSAPLGLQFLQNSAFAVPYRDGAVIALHGSWDRSQPAGYKVVWLPWKRFTSRPGDPIDLVSDLYGFARPVGLTVMPDGSLLFSDDSSGTIYRLDWAPSAVSAASGFGVIAPGSYASLYSVAPLPVNGDFSLTITDQNGLSRSARVVYATPSQINFVVPDAITPGTAHMTLSTATSSTDLGSPEIRSVAPSLFTLTGDGKGVAAVTALDATRKSIETNPIDLSSGPVYLSLYGTGIRNAAPIDIQVIINGAPVRVLYAGPQPTLPALDQINIELPRDLAGSGRVTAYLDIAGTTSNEVELAIR